MKYYIVENHYVGPNPDDDTHIDFDHFEITTTPPRKKVSGDVYIRGYLGTSNDIDRYALGEYDSLSAAEYALQAGPLRHTQYRCDPMDDLPPDVLAVYRPGLLPPMSEEALGQWLECSVHITADDTDMDLVRQAGALRYELEEDGYSVTMERMLSALESLRAELED